MKEIIATIVLTWLVLAFMLCGAVAGYTFRFLDWLDKKKKEANKKDSKE